MVLISACIVATPRALELGRLLAKRLPVARGQSSAYEPLYGGAGERVRGSEAA